MTMARLPFLRPYSPPVLPLLLLALLATSPSALADLRLDGGDDLGWDATEWRAQVDGVMGGKSSGSLSFERSETVLSFSGNVVLNGGGFSSVRRGRLGSDGSPVDLTPYAGVVVTLEMTQAYDGDDVRPPLGLHLQFHDTVSRYIGYASAFAVPLASVAGEEASVFLPLSSFDRGSRMGFQCKDCQIDFSSVDEMDIYVLFQNGPFDIRVKEITAVDASRSYPSPVVEISSANEIMALIETTIQSGGALYDYGYMELCIAIYRSTLNTLLGAESDNDGDSEVVSKAIKGMICQGLQRADAQGSTLRYTMDGILEELGFSDPGTGWRPTALTDETLAIECDAVTSALPAPGIESNIELEASQAAISGDDANEILSVTSSSSSFPFACAGMVVAFAVFAMLHIGS